jgi:hypothetical protein
MIWTRRQNAVYAITEARARSRSTEASETDAARLRRFGSSWLAQLITTPNNDP